MKLKSLNLEYVRPSYADAEGEKPLIIFRLPKVLEVTGLGRSTVYAKIKAKHKDHDPTFPKPIHLASRATGWLASELDDWIVSRMLASRLMNSK